MFDFKRDCRGVISVIGASEIDKDIEEKSLEIGRLIAKNKYALVCGGLTGVMEFVCKGAKEEHGVTIGIIPSKEKSMANKYIDIAIPVPFSQARNIVVVLTGDVVVAIGGMAGTLNEISLAWIYEKPIVALSSVEGWSSKMANTKVDNRRPDIIYGAESPSEVINKVNELIKTNKSRNIQVTNVAYSPAFKDEFTTNILENVPVGEVMTKKVITISPENTVKEVDQLIKTTEHSIFPVVKDNRLIGLVGRGDIKRVPVEQMTNTSVDQIMVKENIITITPEEIISKALDKIVKYGHSHIPVVDKEENSKIVGILTKHDIINAHNIVKKNLEIMRKG